MSNPRNTHQYRLALKALKAQGDTYCWRGCGKWLQADLKWPHPNSITLGHLVALEDGGHPTDPSNHAAECIRCNMGDGARRTNDKRANRTSRITFTNTAY